MSVKMSSLFFPSQTVYQELTDRSLVDCRNGKIVQFSLNPDRGLYATTIPVADLPLEDQIEYVRKSMYLLYQESFIPKTDPVQEKARLKEVQIIEKTMKALEERFHIVYAQKMKKSPAKKAPVIITKPNKGTSIVAESKKTAPIVAESNKDAPVAESNKSAPIVAETTPIAESDKDAPVEITSIAESNKDASIVAEPVETIPITESNKNASIVAEPVETTPVAEPSKNMPIVAGSIETIPVADPANNLPITYESVNNGVGGNLIESPSTRRRRARQKVFDQLMLMYLLEQPMNPDQEKLFVDCLKDGNLCHYVRKSLILDTGEVIPASPERYQEMCMRYGGSPNLKKKSRGIHDPKMKEVHISEYNFENLFQLTGIT